MSRIDPKKVHWIAQKMTEREALVWHLAIHRKLKLEIDEVVAQ